MRWKEFSVELQKMSAALEDPKKTVASIFSLEPPILFLELAVWPNFAIGREGPWLGR
jgi:hypothetical protein